MKHPIPKRILLVFLSFYGFCCVSGTAEETGAPQFRLGFGSCLKQRLPQPVWDGVLASNPDAFVLAGDNVYADTRDPDAMRSAYRELAAQPGFRQLRQACRIYAIWDDHDYGENDAGSEYPMKQMSAQIFFDFFEVPADSPRRYRPGVFGRHLLETPVGRIQVILLDTRWFRGPLSKRPTASEEPEGPYVAAEDPRIPMLGEAQWQWLERVLTEPADWRVLVSSIQIIPQQHGWEKWANLPHERDRLLGLLRALPDDRLVLISGDRHHGEISQLELHPGRPLYEVTASGMNCALRGPGTEPNRYRVGDRVTQDQFGLLIFRGAGSSSRVDLQLRDIQGAVLHSVTLRRNP